MPQIWTDPLVLANAATIVVSGICLLVFRDRIRARTALAVAATFTLAVLAGIAIPLIARLRPSLLVVHAPAGVWRSITVESYNLPHPQTFTSDPVIVTPISHGYYRISIQFNDSVIVWARLFHLDAGVRRRVDVFVERPSPNRIVFVQAINEQEIVFKGETDPAHTSPDAPFYLERVP